MEDDIELDDVRIVNVTGKVHKDLPQKKKKKTRCWVPSLRARTIMIVTAIAIVYFAAVAGVVVSMRNSLVQLDQDACQESIDRFAMLFFDDIIKVEPFCRYAAFSKFTADAIDDPSNMTALNLFIHNLLNTTVVRNPDGTAEKVYGCSNTAVNFWALIDRNFNVVWSEYHPAQGNTLCTLGIARPGPLFPNGYLQSIIMAGAQYLRAFVSFYAPAIIHDPMAVIIEPILIPNEKGEIDNDTPHGYLLAARTMKYRMSLFANDVPSCITMASGENDTMLYFDDTDMEQWNKSTWNSFTDDKKFAGVPAFLQRDKNYLESCEIRVCPEIPLFDPTDELMTGYFTLCGLDPKKNNRTTCIYLRMDRPMSHVDQGSVPLLILTIEVLVLLVVIMVFFIVFLDLFVLRRIVKLSDVIHEQTSNQDKTLDTVDVDVGKRGANKKRGKKARSSGDKGSAKSSSDTDGSNGARGRDEIATLKRNMEANAAALKQRLDNITDSIKIEQQKAMRHKNALQLLNLWCGRKEYFPALRPNAAQLRYEPTRSLDDLLADPLAVEYLKSHCDSDRTLENLWFLLDVSWLAELETAEDKEEDLAKRKQIHHAAAATAETILSRYIAVNAPQQINLSAGAFEALRDKGSSYKRGMFKDAVSEVKLMLDTDILPRFQKTLAYTAMSENMFVDSFAEADETDLSSETVSTAGSVLIEEAEGETGVNHMFAFNFKNLYASFDAADDEGSTYTDASLLVDGPVSSSLVGDTQTKTSGTGAAAATSSSDKVNTVDSSQHETSSVTGSEASDAKKGAAPQKIVLGKPGPSKKDESSDSSSDSTDSSTSSDTSSSN